MKQRNATTNYVLFLLVRPSVYYLCVCVCVCVYFLACLFAALCKCLIVCVFACVLCVLAVLLAWSFVWLSVSWMGSLPFLFVAAVRIACLGICDVNDVAFVQHATLCCSQRIPRGRPEMKGYFGASFAQASRKLRASQWPRAWLVACFVGQWHRCHHKRCENGRTARRTKFDGSDQQMP
jgi:hypothetical protein